MLRKGVDFFYQQGATSADTAIEVTDTDWLYIFNQPVEQQTKLLKLLTYIKKTPDSKFWIDMDEYAAFLKRNTAFAQRLGIAFIALILLLIAFGIYADIRY